ncbi:hypothetical protein CHS0354_014672 [Potamilus streckersoni]|uniref:C3H1-type domain-containing protein n=1 Tax=Potamilus streckersoni TaxID=2493646 RepID=A0AAE0SQ23_9BIVA|nr:hypothetical protein CHS0354_014672 [Potamilus streckersoni]
MKYPEYRLSMEAALPSSVQSWFRHELELLGIDSIVYSHYVISLLRQDSAEVELESSEADVHFLEKKVELKQPRGKKSEKKRVSISEEDKRKHAAVQCLVSVADETSGIEKLVEELCSRLKDCQQVLCSPMVPCADQSQQSSVCSSDPFSSDESGSECQDPAERYYAAFPALHGQDKCTEPSLAIPKDTVWKKNPLVKSAALAAVEDEEKKRKENQHCISLSDTGKISKDKKDHASNKGNKLDNKFCSTQNHRSKSSSQSSKEEVDDSVKSRRFRSWPVSYAENDVRYLEEKSKKKIARSNEELCTRVESLLKGMLLPIPDKRYKELEDVDEEPSSKVQVRKSPESLVSADKQRANSISPELQENTDWYTEPMEIFNQPAGNACKQPLYKRNSYPHLSPCGEDIKFQSDKSSPTLFDCENYVDRVDDEDILMDGNLLIPAWLTSELEMPLHNDDALRPIEELVEKLETDESCMVTLGWNTIKVDPNLWQVSTSDLMEKNNEACFKVPRFTMSSRKPSEEDEVFFIPAPTGCIDTITEGKPSITSKLRLKSDSASPTTSLSLVDWQYLSRFLDVQGFSAYDACFDSSLWTCAEDYPVEPGPVPCWQSKILFNEFLNSFNSEEEANIWGWSWDKRMQQLGDWENFSQLWNVNNQLKAKTSPWSSSLQPILGLWFENNLEKEIQQQNSDLGKNTLIPKISVELDLDENLDDRVFERDNASVLFERSTSLGNVSFWDTDEQSQFIPNPKLSQSFELVPSEHSAFDDVPRKLPHVHSEPNLVLYRQFFADVQIDSGDKQTKSPQEHLYFSPKTHFRPITPAYAPELSTIQPKEPAHLSHDLFGGYFASKTPYQQYHCRGDGAEEDGDSFVPKFKLKNSSKYIQTGDSLENNGTANTSCEGTKSSEIDCKTPEAITMATVEEQLLDKEATADVMGKTEKEKHSANIDSAYETDYGISILDQEQSFEEKTEQYWNENVSDSNLGSDSAAGNLQYVCQENELSDRKVDIKNVEEENNAGCQAGTHWSVQEIWGTDYDPQYFGFDGQIDEKYQKIWSTGQDSLIPDISCLSLHEVQREPCLPVGEYLMLENMDYPFGSGAHTHDKHLDLGVHLQDEQINVCQGEFSEAIPECTEESPVTKLTEWTEAKVLDTGQLLKTLNPNLNGSFNDYVSVKLVYKDRQSSQDVGDKSYGDGTLVPMPGEALYSSELEREWLNRDDQSRHLKKSRFQRKPCSYFLEGICRRSDCKFAHDIANITCRFWEDGECFKGPLCPFLHGYPSDSDPVSEEGDLEKFELCLEEFPEIQKSHSEKSAVLGKKLHPGRSLNSRKEGCRKQYRWKSSSRQLKSESKT